MMDLILSLVVILLIVICPWLALRWVLGPLDRAARNRSYPVQFSLADFLCLFVQAQLVLAGPALLFRTMEVKTSAAMVSVLIVALVLVVWWTGVRTLSRAGVHGTLGRAFTLTIAIPFGFAGAAAIPLLGISFLYTARASGLPAAGFCGLCTVPILGLEWLLGIATRRVLASSDRKTVATRRASE